MSDAMMPSQLKNAIADEKYKFNKYSLDKVRNRQEARVIDTMEQLLSGAGEFCGCRLCVEDVYAISLNAVPAHYVQAGSMILRQQPPSQQDLARVVQDAIDKVKVRPNHPEQ